MSENTGDRSAAEIERDVERTRARLTGTVEELKDRVSPGQLAEQAMDWLRGSGGRQFVGNLGTTLRDNPMPVLLVAAGIGWMALSSGRDRAPRRWTDEDEDRYGAGGYAGAAYPRAYAGESYAPETYAGQGLRDDGGPSIGERAGEAASGLRDKAGELANRVGGTASDAAQGVGDAVRSVTDSARSAAGSAAAAGRDTARRAGEAWHGAADRAAHLGDRAWRTGAGAGRSVAQTLEAQPLLLGAIGLAVGAALGALVPHSAAEDRLMGESRDRMADRLSALAKDAYGTAREVAVREGERAQETLGEAYGQIRERVAGNGVSATEGASALGGVARDLREAVERTAQDAASAVRDAAGGSSDEPPRGKPGGGASTGMPPARSGPQGGGPV